MLLEYAHKMLNLRKDAGAALVDLRSLHRGRLDLAANEYTCLYLLPVLDAFRREHPRIKVAVQRTLASRIADEVQSHSVEIGVVSFRPADPQVVSTLVYTDELVCVMSPEHALAKAGKATIARLGRETFVAHNVPSPLRQKVIETFPRKKIPLQMEVELPSLEAIKRFVQMGNGVALVPRLTVEGELESGDAGGGGGAGVADGAEAAAGASARGGAEPCGAGVFAGGAGACGGAWEAVLFCGGEGVRLVVSSRELR